MIQMKEYEERKRSLGIEWIRSSSTGTGYLCPVGIFRGREDVSEEELQKYCVDESSNPQND